MGFFDRLFGRKPVPLPADKDEGAEGHDDDDELDDAPAKPCRPILGPPDLSLLSALYPHMADENLALAMSEHTGRDIAVVLNDILLAGSRTDVISEADDRVRRRLWDAGFDAWVAEEDG